MFGRKGRLRLKKKGANPPGESCWGDLEKHGKKRGVREPRDKKTKTRSKKIERKAQKYGKGDERIRGARRTRRRHKA